MMAIDPFVTQGRCKCGRMEFRRCNDWPNPVEERWHHRGHRADYEFCPFCGSECRPDGTALDVAGKLEAAEKRVVELEGAVATPDENATGFYNDGICDGQ
jgi:hypothetical protein